MTEMKRRRRSQNDVQDPASRAGQLPLVGLPMFLMLMLGLVFGISVQALAEPSGTPTANRIFFNCTFTTAGLNSVLNISQKNRNAIGGQLQASYIIIYVRGNPNDGQSISGTTSYTGPVLCINANTEDVIQTTETTQIPAFGENSIDILGAEEALHLQYQPNLTTGPGAPEKRVCHTVASNTDCFFIRPQ